MAQATSGRHEDLPEGEIHIINNFEFADAAARNAAVVVTADIGKVAKQSDDNTYYILIDTTPTWSQIDSAGFDTFLELTDAPSSYSGEAGKVAIVNDAEDALEFGQQLRTTDSPTFAQLNVDNLRLDGNTLSSTDTDGDILISPDGTGTAQIANEVSIGDLSDPTTDASLDLKASDKALLFNRLTTTERDALTPTEGMGIFNTTTLQLENYDGTSWTAMGGGDVSGPPSSVDTGIATYLGTGGKNIQSPVGLTFDGTSGVLTQEETDAFTHTTVRTQDLGTNNVQEIITVGDYVYIYNAGGTTLNVFNIDQPSGAVQVGSLSNSSFDGGRMVIAGKFAYLTSSSNDELLIVDISIPGAPALRGTVSDATDLNGASEIDIKGQYVFVGAVDNDSLTTIDISDPDAPAIVNVFVDGSALEAITALTIQGDFLYVSNLASLQIASFDITDPLSPVLLDTVNSFTAAGSQQLIAVGPVLYIAGTNSNSVATINISDPSNLVTLDNITFTSVNGIAVSGDFMYAVSSALSELNVYDISNPNDITLLTNETGFNEAVRLSLNGNFLYAGHDGGATGVGFSVIRIAGTQLNATQVGSLKANKLDVLGAANFDDAVSMRDGLTVAGGILVQSAVVTPQLKMRNFQTVEKLTDFPPAVAGVITLRDNTLYEVIKSFDTGTDRIVYGIDSKISGLFEAAVITGTPTSGALFTSHPTNLMYMENIVIKHNTNTEDAIEINTTARANFRFVNCTGGIVRGVACAFLSFVNCDFTGGGRYVSDGSGGPDGMLYARATPVSNGVDDLFTFETGVITGNTVFSEVAFIINGVSTAIKIENGVDIGQMRIDQDTFIPTGAAATGVSLVNPDEIGLGIITNTSFSGNPAATKLKVDPVRTSSFATVGNTSRDIAYDGVNLISCDATLDQIYLHSGITSTISTTIASPSINPSGVTWANGNLISSDQSSGLIQIHDGFSTTITSSFATPGSSPRSLAFDGRNLIIDAAGGDQCFLMDGITSTILETLDTSSLGTNIFGVAWDGRNLLFLLDIDDEVIVCDGFSVNELYRFTTPTGGSPYGIVVTTGNALAALVISDFGNNDISLFENSVVFDQGSDTWIFTDNIGLKVSATSACTNVDLPAGEEVTINTVNVWEDISDGGTAIFWSLQNGVEKFFQNDDENGELTYIGTRDISFVFEGSVAVQGTGGTDNIEIGISLNDFVPQSKAQCSITSGVVTNIQRASISMPASPIRLVNGDTVRLQVRNTTDASNIEFFQAKMSVTSSGF